MIGASANRQDLRRRRFPVTVKLSILLTDEQHAFAKAMVDAGCYPSPGGALRLLDRRDSPMQRSQPASTTG
jgi:hypothetical protein